MTPGLDLTSITSLFYQYLLQSPKKTRHIASCDTLSGHPEGTRALTRRDDPLHNVIKKKCWVRAVSLHWETKGTLWPTLTTLTDHVSWPLDVLVTLLLAREQLVDLKDERSTKKQKIWPAKCQFNGQLLSWQSEHVISLLSLLLKSFIFLYLEITH